MKGKVKTPRERLREHLEKVERELAELPDWLRESLPRFADWERPTRDKREQT